MKQYYCRECGSKLEEVKTGYYINSKPSFNQKTGKVNTHLQCLNQKCEEGCRYITGHKIPFFSNTCKLCGYVEQDY